MAESEQVIAGRYRLIERLDTGGTSEVWRAEDSSLARTVAVKILKGAYVTQTGYLDRFLTEAKAAANLSHANMVSVYDWGQEGDQHYVVMEYVPGTTLKDILAERGVLKADQAIDIALELASALSYAHEAGIVHQAIRPEYVLIGSQGDVMLTDFGVARDEGPTADETAMVTGSPHYISPEQAQGKPTGPTTDVYGLGVILYQMITGRVPFDGDTPVEIAMKHVNDEPVPPRSVNKAVSPELEAVVLKAMAKAPEHRYPSVADMAADLERVRIVAEPAADLAHVQIGSEPVARRGRTRFWVVALLVVVVAALAAYALWAASQANFVTMPDVVGTRTVEATAALSRLGLDAVVRETVSETVAVGYVVAQQPPAGTRVPRASAVALTVSAGRARVLVGEYVGLPLADALRQIVADGLRQGAIVRRSSSTIPGGTVMSQDPRSGARVAPGRRVNVIVSSGIASGPVPDVVGLARAAAVARLQAAAYRASIVTRFSDQPSGEVFDQIPDAGTSLVKGSAVTIYVSRGPQLVRVPDVVGDTETTAVNRIRAVGLEALVTDRLVVDPAEVGEVQSQDPDGGTLLRKGSQVTIVVGRAP